MRKHIDSAPARISKAWEPFRQALAQVLGELPEDSFLIFSVKGTNRYVQFAAQGDFGLRVETTSNAYLEKHDQLRDGDMTMLRRLGWQIPTGSPAQSTPARDPDGSPNYFVEIEPPASMNDAAELAVRTLREVFHVSHPGWMEYEAFTEDGDHLSFPQLKVRRRSATPGPSNGSSVPGQLLATIAKVTGNNDLKFDKDGDVMLRYGSACVAIRLAGNPPYVRFYSPVVVGVQESTELLQFLNGLNGQGSGTLVRYSYQDGCVYAFAEVQALPYVDAHVSQTLAHFSALIDGLDAALQEEFGGRTAFPESPSPAATH